MPQGSSGAPSYAPGQYAAFEFTQQLLGVPDGSDSAPLVQRTWTVSSHPRQSAQTGTFTMTIKRAGLVSSWMHDELRVGQALPFRGFGGDFTPALLDGAGPATQPPGVLLLAGGIGITPMRPILEELVARAAAGGSAVPSKVLLGLWVQRADQAALTRELGDIARRAPEGMQVQLVLFTTRGGGASSGDVAGWRGAEGRLTAAALSEHARLAFGVRLGDEGEEHEGGPLAGWASFVCGPPGFMLGAEAALAGAGADLGRMHTEAFSY